MEIVPLILPLIKELIMQYGLLEIVASLAFLILVWRIPNIILALKEYLKSK